MAEYEARVATAAEAERAIGKAMTTQVDSLKRQVATLDALQAENEALKTAQEVCVHATLFAHKTLLVLLVLKSPV